MKSIIDTGGNATNNKDSHPLMGSFTLSKVATRNFCTGCGSLIFMDYHAPNTVWVPLGILDDDSVGLDVTAWMDHTRDSQIFAKDKVPWMEALQSLPLLESFGTYKADVCGDIPFDELPSWQEDVKDR